MPNKYLLATSTQFTQLSASYILVVDLDTQIMIAAIVTDSGLSESSESAVTLTTDNLQQHVIASASATTPVTVSQPVPGLGVIGSNNYGTTGANVGAVNTAALMEMGHSRNSSNTSQVSPSISQQLVEIIRKIYREVVC